MVVKGGQLWLLRVVAHGLCGMDNVQCRHDDTPIFFDVVDRLGDQSPRERVDLFFDVGGYWFCHL